MKPPTAQLHAWIQAGLPTRLGVEIPRPIREQQPMYRDHPNRPIRQRPADEDGQVLGGVRFAPFRLGADTRLRNHARQGG